MEHILDTKEAWLVQVTNAGSDMLRNDCTTERCHAGQVQVGNREELRCQPWAMEEIDLEEVSPALLT